MEEMELEDYLKLPQKKKREEHEYHDQCAIFQWAKLQEAAYPELKYLFSTLNGVWLPVGLAKKAKASGNKRGVPDIWLPVKRGRWSGLVVELKHGDNQPSPEQLDWIAFLNGQGYYAMPVWGVEETINTIILYLEGKL